MCKKLIYLVFVFMVVGLIGPVAAQQVDMEIGFATQPPVIDGEVDETWADASTQSFVPLDDPANASGIWKVLYDSVNLYVIVDMTDDSLQNDSDGSWQDDSVELYFDGGNTKVNTPLSGDDHQYTFGWTTDEIQGTNVEGATDGIEHAQVTTDTGWRIEIKMPWLSIQGAEPQAGDLIGIDCYYNDDDDGGDSRENKLLSFSTVEGWNDASQWGTAILAAEPEPEPAGPKIIWVSFHGADDAPSGAAADVGFTEASDKGYTDLLKANGYNVTRYITSSTPDPEVLNAADLVIISRAVSSGGYSNDGATAWNGITSPMIIMGGYVLRNSRMGYTTGGTMVDTTGDVTLTVTDPTHPIFAGIALTDGTMDNSYAGGAVVLPTDGVTLSRGISINNDPADDEGTVLATIAEASADTGPVGGMVIGEWPAGATLTHAGGAETDTLAGPRLVFLTGSREPDGVTGGDAAGLYDLFPDGEQMFLNAVNYMIPVKLVDVTAPGDAIQGVPNDGDWPGAETPDLAIDDDTSTKYLHFKGETETTGFQVTPSSGGSIVTGLTLTTANDAAERDPIAFELSGSNESIDGPYELIASGEVVDFAQADAWPRFTMNATPILFDNDVAYAHYQVLFPAVRDPASANSMQIAEVELLGLPDPAGPVGHWKLDEGEGAVAVDSSGNGNDGTIGNLNGGLGLDGSVWVDDPERGTVISFNGTAEGAFVRAGNIPQMTLTNDFTWAFWAKHNAENTADNDIILGNRMDENVVDFVPRQFIKFTPTKFEWHMNGNGDDNLDYDDIPADVWLHHAVVKTADQLTYYRNGIEASSGTFTQPLDFPQPLFFGGDNEGSAGENWSGLMSDVRIYNRALTENEVIGLAGKTPVDPGTDGLVAFYALENDVTDSSGNGNDGTIVGAPTFVDGPAGYGMAMEFHGLGAPGGGGDYIDCGNDASLDITGPISLALWIRPGADDPEGQGTETAPMAKAMDGVGWSWQVRYGWGSPQPYMAFTFNSSPRAWAYVGRNLERDEWCHIACSHDGTTLKCFLNGEQTDSTPMGQITSSEAPILIGSDGWGCDWIGAIDEVAIYNRDLSGGEVRYLAGFREMVEPGTKGLAAAYEFETDATDSSGNGNDGTLLGDANVQGGLLVLDGDDDAVAIPGIGDGLNEFTFSMMVYPTVDVVPLQFSGGINTDSWDGGVHLKLNNGTVNVGVNGLAGGDVVGTSIAQPNTWTHLALTVSPEEVAVYFNGEKEGSRVGEAVPAVNVAAATIGAWNNGGTDVQREMTGMMDNVLIYDRALSEAEVRYLASVKADPMNLVQNPSFEEDEPILDDPDWVQWCTWNPAEGAGSNTTIVDTESINGTRSLQVEPKGVENWHFILVNISFAANLDKNYTAGFWAKAVAPRPLTVQMKASDNSVDAWGATDFELTTEWTEYTYTSEVLHTDVKLEFLCAGSEVPFWLDLVSVYEAD